MQAIATENDLPKGQGSTCGNQPCAQYLPYDNRESCSDGPISDRRQSLSCDPSRASRPGTSGRQACNFRIGAPVRHEVGDFPEVRVLTLPLNRLAFDEPAVIFVPCPKR